MTEKEDGWFVGFIDMGDPKKNVVSEIFEIKDEYAPTDIYYNFETIDKAIEYYELLIRDLKGQKEHNIEFKIRDGTLVKILSL